MHAATGEEVDEETLGGGEMHASVSGVIDYLAKDDEHAVGIARGCVGDLGKAAVRAVEVIAFNVNPSGRCCREPAGFLAAFLLSRTGTGIVAAYV